jgi:hypothetical protein
MVGRISTTAETIQSRHIQNLGQLDEIKQRSTTFWLFGKIYVPQLLAKHKCKDVYKIAVNDIAHKTNAASACSKQLSDHRAQA